jgi:serine O-acetyltransferase
MIDSIALYRMARALHQGGLHRAARALTAMSRLLFSSHIPPEALIGDHCELGYGGIGVVIHREAVIGSDVLISPGGVIGGRSEMEGAPVIGDGVKIGCGAKILGPVRIGAGAKIGANAVVIHDVGPGDTVAGVPAHVVHHRPAQAAS